MGKEKVYILQKDLPNSKVGDEYVLGRCNAYYKNANECEGFWLKEYVENNPDWFLPKEEVKPLVTRCNYDSYSVYFYINDKAPAIELSKEILADILIAHQRGELHFTDGKFYSEKEYLELGEECFNAARINDTGWYVKYKSFSDFMNYKNRVNNG